jgi:hypothetical protein
MSIAACARAERGDCHDGTVTHVSPQDADKAVAKVLAAVGQADGNAAAVVRTVRDWAVTPDFRITGGAERTYPSFTVRARTGRRVGTGFGGVLTLYADSRGSGPALEVRVIEMCSTPPYDREPARGRLTADLHALEIPRLDREDVLSRKRPDIPLAELTDGRLEWLLAIIGRWLGEVQAHRG